MAVVGPSNGFSRILPGPIGQFVDRLVNGARPAQEVDRIQEAARMWTRDGVEPSQLLLRLTMDRMFGRSLPEEGFVARPTEALSARLESGDRPRGFNPLGSSAGKQKRPEDAISESIQQAMEEDPQFREQLESALKGQIIPGGTDDGKLLAWRAPGNYSGKMFSTQADTAAPVATATIAGSSRAPNSVGMPLGTSSILSGLQRMEANVTELAKKLTKSPDSQQALQGSDGADFGSVTSAMMKASGDDADAGGLSGMPFTKSMLQQFASPPDQMVPQGTPGTNEPSDTMRQQMLQKMMEDLKKMYELLTDILKTMNSMQMEAIRNIA